jgi:hypothetical protein
VRQNSGVATRNLSRTVGGTIIDDDDLPGQSEPLAGDRVESIPDDMSDVACGDDHTDIDLSQQLGLAPSTTPRP